MLGRSQNVLCEAVEKLFVNQQVETDYFHLDLRYQVRFFVTRPQ